jgi:TonB family protein
MNLNELTGEYEIIGELGRGGTSIVYRARERELGREVAIKVVRSSHTDDTEAVARLAREAKLVAMLRHPNIVPLLSIRHLTDGLALIMQHVPGRTLKRAIKEDGPMSVAMTEHVLREIGSALDYAHKKHGIVHRDIKPENIYLDEEVGRALLSDFGIARTTESESNLTLVGTALGTPAYMSPEQIDGTALDGRSDLYSLGLVAHEMLSGQQPWAGNNLYTIIYKQKNEELPALSSFRSDIPGYLQRAVDGLLRKNADERFADATQFIGHLPSSNAVPDFTPSVREAVVVTPVADEETPTLRYQRPTLVVEDVPPAPPAPSAPAPEPVVGIEPAAAAVAAVLAAEPAPQVLELPTLRPNWRRPAPRGRGAIATGGVFVPAEISPVEAAAIIEGEDEAVVVVPFPGLRKRLNPRLVAGLTVFLLLSASATVVAMRNVRAKSNNELASSTTGQGEFRANDGLIKASGPALPNLNGSAAQKTSTGKPATQVAAKTEAQESPAQPIIGLPNVAIPEIALASAGTQVTEADFSNNVKTSTAPTENITSEPTFTPYTVKPELKNRAAVARVLADQYPRVMRERGLGGTVQLWVLIDSVGKVIKSQVNVSSGNEFLDKAAIKVADAMQFTPAQNLDRKVSIWIQLPVNFKTN